MTLDALAPLLAQLVAQHMGALHAYEQYMVMALAFGPFVVLGIVVYFVRRRDLAEDRGDDDSRSAGEPAASDGAHSHTLRS